MAAVVTAASRINRDLESDEFVAEAGAMFAAPRAFQPELLGAGTVRPPPLPLDTETEMT
jgi:hypothetical protein